MANTEQEGSELTRSEQEMVAKEGVSICCHQDLQLKVNIGKSTRKFSYLCKTRVLRGGLAFHWPVVASGSKLLAHFFLLRLSYDFISAKDQKTLPAQNITHEQQPPTNHP